MFSQIESAYMSQFSIMDKAKIIQVEENVEGA